MSMQTANRARPPLYKLTDCGHVVTAGAVKVEVRYCTRTNVRVEEFVFRHHFKFLEILPDVVLGSAWLRSDTRTVDWKERYADVRHASASYQLSFDNSRHSTQVKFQAASKFHLLSTPSSSTPKVSLVGTPTQPAEQHPDLHSPTRAKSDANTLVESQTEDGITDEECREMIFEYISLPKLKPEICRATLTSDQVFLCCMPLPAVPVDQMYNMQKSSDNDGLELI